MPGQESSSIVLPDDATMLANQMESASAASVSGKFKHVIGMDGNPLRRSKIGDAHPAVAMNEDNVLNKKDKNSTGASDHQANQHRWTEQWTKEDLTDIGSVVQGNSNVIAHKVSSKPDCEDDANHLALVDRGANGIAAGEDCRFIGQWSMGGMVNATGIDDHQMTDIKVGTVGSLAKSNQGDVIIIANEAAHAGEHTTVLSALQLERCGNFVGDQAAEEKGRQKTIAPEGHVFPLSAVNGLACLKMRRCTDAEFDSLPNIVPTSDEVWNPRQCNKETSADDTDFMSNNPTNHHLLPCDDCNAKGECIGNPTEHTEALSNASDSSIHATIKDAQHFHDQSATRCTCSAFKAATSDLWACVATRRGARANPVTDDESADDAPRAFGTGIRVHKASDADCQALKPCFGHLPVKTTARTFENSTQCGHVFNSKEGNQFWRHKSPQPAMNIHRWDKDILMDETFSGVPAINGGFKSAVVFFGRESHIMHAEEMTGSKRLLQCLQKLTTKHGAPSQITADHVRHQESFQVPSHLRMLWIRLWFSKACHHNQNLFERKWQTFKRLVDGVTDRTNAPPHLRFPCMTHLCFMLSQTSDAALQGKQTIHVATGSVGDMSPMLAFRWMQPVHFKANGVSFPKESPEELGHFVGTAEDVGHAMTFKIWNKKTNKVADGSIMRAAEGPDINLKAWGGCPVRSDEDNKEEPPSVTSEKFPNVDPPHGEPDHVEGVPPHPSWEDKVWNDKRDRGENPGQSQQGWHH